MLNNQLKVTSLTNNVIYKIYSHNITFLKSLTKLFFNNNYKKNEKTYTVILKSPHVHKKAQEHFSIVTYLLILKTKNFKTALSIKQYYFLELILNLNNFFLKKKKIIKKNIQFQSQF
jgi:hypothetical protein